MKALRDLAKDWQLWLGGTLVAASLVGVTVWVNAAFSSHATAIENQRLRDAARTKYGAKWSSGMVELTTTTTAKPDEELPTTVARHAQAVKALQVEFQPR